MSEWLKFTRQTIRSFQAPSLTNEEIVKHVQQHFPIKNIDTSSVKPFASYSDRVYYFKGLPVDRANEKEYVFRVLNKEDSKHPQFVSAVTQLLLYIDEKGFDCPVPVQSIHKERNFVVPIQSSDPHSTSLSLVLEYVPGVMLTDINPSPVLLYKMGKFVGELSTALQGFSHPHLNIPSFRTNWSLFNFLEVKPLTKYVDDKEELERFELVFKRFSDYVQPRMPHFKAGTIHGDPNTNNLIFTATDGDDSRKVSGIIDVMDASTSHLIYDGAILIAYAMMMDCANPLEYSKPVVAGYLQNCSLNNEEFDCLYYLIACRMVQSTLNALLADSLEVGNAYRMESLDQSRKVLKKLLNTSKQEMEHMWRDAQLKSYK